MSAERSSSTGSAGALRADDAGAGPHCEVAGTHAYRQRQALERPLCEHQRLGFVGVFEQDRELVTTETGNGVALTYRRCSSRSATARSSSSPVV